MPNIEQKIGTEIEKTQDYYERRLKHIINLIKDNKEADIMNNRKNVKNFLIKYKEKVSDKPDYKELYINFIENIIYLN